MAVVDRSALVALVPGLMGFIPAMGDVVVFALSSAGGVLFTARADAGGGHDGAQWRVIGDAALRQGAVRVALVGVGEVAEGDVAALVEGYRSVGLEPVIALVCESLTAGAAWRDVVSGEQGSVDEPSQSVVMAERVAMGGVVASSRDELSVPWVGRAVESVRPRRASARLLEEVLDGLHAVAVGSDDAVGGFGCAVTAVDAARFGSVLGDVRRRDLALVVPASVAGMKRLCGLWLQVAAFLDGQVRLEALAVAVLYAYMGGDGAVANVGLSVIEGEAVGGLVVPSLAVVCDGVVRVGLSPERVVAALCEGRGVGVGL